MAAKPRFCRWGLLLLANGVLALPAAEPGAAAKAEPGSSLSNLVDSIADSTLRAFAGKQLKSNELAISLIHFPSPSNAVAASYRGTAPIYPASVVKLFYLVAAHQWLESGQLADTPELRRAMHDMIADSSNDATSYILDALTGTTSGPELPAGEMALWAGKRNAVNRCFKGLGFEHINVNQKPWNEGPYGRERVFLGTNYNNCNLLTTEATARLLSEIALGQAVSKQRSDEMLKLLERAPFQKKNPDEQAAGYSGRALPKGSKLWSKAGWTRNVRHDAALVELPNGKRFILVVFTTNHSREEEIIPSIARQVIKKLR